MQIPSKKAQFDLKIDSDSITQQQTNNQSILEDLSYQNCVNVEFFLRSTHEVLDETTLASLSNEIYDQITLNPKIQICKLATQFREHGLQSITQDSLNSFQQNSFDKFNEQNFLSSTSDDHDEPVHITEYGEFKQTNILGLLSQNLIDKSVPLLIHDFNYVNRYNCQFPEVKSTCHCINQSVQYTNKQNNEAPERVCNLPICSSQISSKLELDQQLISDQNYQKQLNVSQIATNFSINSDVDKKPQRIKVDAIWKPILRKFRKHFQSLVKKSNLGVGYHYWSKDRVLLKIVEMMKIINLDKSYIRDEKSIVSFIILIFSTKSNELNKLHQKYLDKWLDQLADSFRNIFSANNRQKIANFFSESLINELWKIYLKQSNNHQLHMNDLQLSQPERYTIFVEELNYLMKNTTLDLKFLINSH
ncbi:UNKNOWN [Stylonychia lemnae]|uniref:Uncharacterized protein n=1 Tax=Stylonychia lemnae TaxID=5949 RepID=A0A077ZU94_STYLE|nr:UNKNOWN [Stylonychia lemnae]|eukprot:CDW72860.1 UNKNOWN [Stylonychia lemnae]